jgi:DNA-binding NarL/FixJ family response regulator
LRARGTPSVGRGRDAGAEGAGRAAQIDVVITDLLMPERDGLEFITEVRKKFPEVKIIAMSGGGHIARDSYLRIAKNFGAHVLLEKPFSQSGVLGAIEAVLAIP